MKWNCSSPIGDQRKSNVDFLMYFFLRTIEFSYSFIFFSDHRDWRRISMKSLWGPKSGHTVCLFSPFFYFLLFLSIFKCLCFFIHFFAKIFINPCRDTGEKFLTTPLKIDIEHSKYKLKIQLLDIRS